MTYVEFSDQNFHVFAKEKKKLLRKKVHEVKR